jgi:hypothetical protein
VVTWPVCVLEGSCRAARAWCIWRSGMTAADASSPSFPHLARGCPRARRRPWRGIPERAFHADGAEVWTLGAPGSVVRAERELQLVAPPGARSAHLSQTSLEQQQHLGVTRCVSVAARYVLSRVSTVRRRPRVARCRDGPPAACRTRPCARPDMSAGNVRNTTTTRPALVRSADAQTTEKRGRRRKGGTVGTDRRRTRRVGGGGTLGHERCK